MLTETMPSVRSASVGVWIGVGSRDEGPDEIGAAHYLEHLLFKGTARRTAAQIAEEIDAVGGELNAFTAKEHTCFYAHVLDTDLALAVDLLADVVTAATLAPADVELERGVVLEEIAMRDDDPEDLVGEVFDAAMFGEHPLARPVLGTEQSIRGITREALHGFWRGGYTTPRVVVAAAGNIEHDRVVELVDAAFGAAAAGTGHAEPSPPRAGRARLTGTRPLRLVSEDSEQVHLLLGALAPNRRDDRRTALGVLNTALGGGISSRLFQQVREQRGLAYSVYSSWTGYSDTGSLSVYAGCQPKRLGAVVTVVRDVLTAVAGGGLTAAELARAKGSMRGGLVLGLEDTASRMGRLGRAELERGRQRSMAESLELIDAVTSDDVAALAAEVLTGPLTAAVVGPYKHTDDLPAELRELVSDHRTNGTFGQ
ncbi:MAG: M16 family metallopeptidase [Pseudonocardia sp.]